jgi:aminopeptidase-like protein
LDFIRPSSLAGTLKVVVSILDVIENDYRYISLNPYCEPQLGKRNLYRSTGGESIGEEIDARLWVMNFSDGEHSLLDITEKSSLRFGLISEAAKTLCEAGLLSPAQKS